MPNQTPSQWLERWAYRSASRHDARLLADYTGTPPDSSNSSRTHVLLVAISAVFVLADLACWVLGVLLVLHDFPSARIFPGLALIALGYVFRPRLGRGPRRKHQLRREQAPVFFDLLDQVATATGTSVPESVVLAAEYNASASRHGLRGHHSLSVGIPLWLVVPPPMRVALLAHELGHFVNRDPNRGVLVAPALNTVGRLAAATGAERTLGHVFDPDRRRGFAQLIFETVLWVISRPLLLLDIGLLAVCLRDHQRAEIRADDIATKVAGTDALTGLLDRFVLSDTIETTIFHAAVKTPPSGWSALADRVHQNNRAAMAQHREFTRLATSILSSHPPLGVRADLAESWPHQPAAVTLSESQWITIDQELSPWYTAAHKAVLSSRDYHPTQQLKEPLTG